MFDKVQKIEIIEICFKDLKCSKFSIKRIVQCVNL